MEELGIGRPSTYASILSVLQDRKYVRLDKRRFIPEDRGRLVTAFLVSFFEHYVDTGFTASLEEKLDDISGGETELARGDARVLGRVLPRGRSDQGPEDQRRHRRRWTRISARISSRRARTAPTRALCPACGTGRLGLKLGRYGSFIGCSNYPACQYTRRLAIETGEDQGETLKEGMRVLGQHPETGEEITVRRGPYGLVRAAGRERRREDKGKTRPSRGARRCRAAWTATRSRWSRRSGLLSLPRADRHAPGNAASRSRPGSGGSGRMCGWARSTARWTATTTCWPSASTARWI